jgi:argininosuccinate synthase
VLLHAAHRELQDLVIARDLERLTRQLGRAYADLVYNGLWFSQMREAIDGFVRTIQPRVTGSVRLKLFKGGYRVVGRQSPYALYDRALATYDAGDSFDRSATEGFIKIWGLPIETAARKAAAHPAPTR